MTEPRTSRAESRLVRFKKLMAGVPVHLSLFILVPFIFTGFAVLAFLVAYQGSTFLSERYLLLVGVAVVFLAALSGVIVIAVILNPLKKFMQAVQQSPALSPETAASGADALRRGDFRRFDDVFQEVTSLISKVAARERFPDIVGQSMEMRSVLGQVVKVAPTDTTVLILGESGVGKERIAEAICRESPRREKPFIKLNCVAIPSGLLESELFGHEKGAFTGAQGRKIGKFELAHQGTLFLDEIGDMSLETQAKLLRVLQERQFERVGGNSSIEVDVRFIAASNKNLRRMVEEGTFREDLFYRLNVFSLYVPPLRERIEDIPLLAHYMLERAPGMPELEPEAMRELMTWHWPGNVRELKNVLERSAVMADGGRISSVGLAHLKRGRDEDRPGETQAAEVLDESPDGDFTFRYNGQPLEEGFSLDDHLAAHEKALILRALEEAGGVQARAARRLGINQRSLWHRIKKYEIAVAEIKSRL